MAVQGRVGGQQVRELVHAFGKSGVERRRGEGVAHGLLADRAELDRAALRQVLELERPQPGDILCVRREQAAAVHLGLAVPVFGHDRALGDVFRQRDGLEVEVPAAALRAVDAGRFKIADEIGQRAQRHAVHPAVVRIEAVETVAPELVASAQELAPFAERGVGEQHGLEGLQRVEGVDGRHDGVLAHVNLRLRGAGEEAEVGMVVEARRAAVL